MMKNKKGAVWLLVYFLMAGFTTAQEEKESSRTSSGLKEEGNHDVMLNASNANGPRETSIGLPGGDVDIPENGLPVVYTSNPHSVSTHWRGDSSLGHVGLPKISETAITIGNIGYVANFFTQLGTKKFRGIVDYSTNYFGKQQFDANISGGMGKGWFYSGSVYQNPDPDSFKLCSTSNQDRTQVYKAALTKNHSEGRGQLSAIYHYSNSRRLSNETTSAPLIYVGDGGMKETPGFSLGISFYLPATGGMVYRDMRTGELKKTNLYSATLNKGNQLTPFNTYTWDNGPNWKVNLKHDHALSSYVCQTPMAMEQKDASASYFLKGMDGILKPYEGYVQSRMSCFNRGTIDGFFATSELPCQYRNMTQRLGVNEWYYKVDYASNTTMHDRTVKEYPERLVREGNTDGMYYDLNKNTSEYYRGHENKLVIYATRDQDIPPQWDVYYGARLEWQHLEGENAAVYDAEGSAVGRFADYYLGTVPDKGIRITPRPFDYDWIDMTFTAAATYKLAREFGFAADFTYNTQRPGLSNFVPTTMPNTDKISVPLRRAGAYYNTDWISLISLFSYISRTNNNSTLNLISPSGRTETLAAPLSYDIKTIGWTTDAVIKPFKGFNFHFLFVYRSPTYKKYETSMTFKGGTIGGINTTGNIVTEIPKVLVEPDPNYNITNDPRVWTSFRYFGKTYASIKNAYYLNGRWGTFGGVNWTVNKRPALSATVANFLNQAGVKGSVAGAELVGKKDATFYNGYWMAGSYIRPFTVEFATSIHF